MAMLMNKYLKIDSFSNYFTDFYGLRHNLKMNDVPNHFREPFIYSGYRDPKSSWTLCLESLISPTNETVNIWTHLIPAFYFSLELFYLINSLDWQLDHEYYAPFIIYIGTIVIYTFISSLAHLFNTMSDWARHICFICDYAAVSAHAHGAALAIWAYSVPMMWLHTVKNGMYPRNYIILSVGTSILSVFLSSRTRLQLATFRRKLMRISAFVLPCFVTISPLFLRFIYCCKYSYSVKEDCTAEFYFNWSCQVFFSMLALTFYISHLPECVFPGRFDIFGHSHQLFHVAGVINTYFQLQTVKSDLINRKLLLIKYNRLPHFSTSYGPFLMVVSCNTFVCWYFIKQVLSKLKTMIE